MYVSVVTLLSVCHADQGKLGDGTSEGDVKPMISEENMCEVLPQSAPTLFLDLGTGKWTLVNT